MQKNAQKFPNHCSPSLPSSRASLQPPGLGDLPLGQGVSPDAAESGPEPRPTPSSRPAPRTAPTFGSGVARTPCGTRRAASAATGWAGLIRERAGFRREGSGGRCHCSAGGEVKLRGWNGSCSVGAPPPPGPHWISPCSGFSVSVGASPQR